MASVRLAATDDDGSTPVRAWFAKYHQQRTIIAAVEEFLFLHQREIDELALLSALAFPDPGA